MRRGQRATGQAPPLARGARRRLPIRHVVRDCRRGDEEARRARRCSCIGVVRSRLAEEETEAWPCRTKASRRRQRDIELQGVREQEYPVDRRSAFEVDEVDRVELRREPLRRVLENSSGRHGVGDREGEIQIGELVAGPLLQAIRPRLRRRLARRPPRAAGRNPEPRRAAPR